MAAHRYLARIYRPHHIRQKRKFLGKLIGCTETVFAMLVDAVTFGGIRYTEANVRAMSSEPNPDPKSPGLNLGQMTAIAIKIHMVYVNRTDRGDPWSEVVQRLNENRRVQVSVYIGVDHSELLQAVRARPGGVAGFEVLKDDPLKGSSEWVVDDTIRHQAEAFSKEHGFSGITYAYSKVLPFVASGAK